MIVGIRQARLGRGLVAEVRVFLPVLLQQRAVVQIFEPAAAIGHGRFQHLVSRRSADVARRHAAELAVGVEIGRGDRLRMVDRASGGPRFTPRFQQLDLRNCPEARWRGRWFPAGGGPTGRACRCLPAPWRRVRVLRGGCGNHRRGPTITWRSVSHSFQLLTSVLSGDQAMDASFIRGDKGGAFNLPIESPGVQERGNRARAHLLRRRHRLESPARHIASRSGAGKMIQRTRGPPTSTGCPSIRAG